MKNKKNSCKICGIFKENGWEIENTPENPFEDQFPQNINHLLIIFEKKNILTSDIIYQCPECRNYFILRKTIPGGSYDAQKTYFIERLTPIKKEEAEEIIQNTTSQETPDNFMRCSDCQSCNMIKTNSNSIGTELFITYQCQDCGYEITLDKDEII